MNEDQSLFAPRQRKLGFAEDDLWSRLPQSVRSRCQQTLGQLLCHVLETESQTRRSDHERKD